MTINRSQSYQPIPANRDQHLFDIAQTVSEEFAGGQYLTEISQTYLSNCHYDFETTRLIFDGDKLIHHWGVWGYLMRLGSARLKVAGVGAVVTRELYRRQGLMASAAKASFKAMYASGYDLSILRGRHYVKFGYARAWNYVTTRLKSEEIPELEIPVYQRLNQSHLDEVSALYNQTYNDLSGSAVRPTYRNLEANSGVYGWFTADGQLAGYVRAQPTDDKKFLQCLEAAGDPQTGLAVLKELYKQAEYETLNFFTLHRQHPWLQWIRRGACLVEDRYFYHTGWRVKVINLQSSLEKMIPLFKEQLCKSHLADWRGELLIDAGDQQASLRISAGQVGVVEVGGSKHTIQGGPAIGRLLIGSDEAREIIQQESIHCSGAGTDLINILFPNRYPMLSHWDEF